MHEILSGVHHWTAVHPNLNMDVSCYYVEPLATILDPLVPDEGLDWFEGRPVERVVLSNGHHDRDCAQFAERFGVPVVRGEAVAGITPHDIFEAWPGEMALHIEHDGGVLAIADAAIHYGGQLGFVPEQYMNDDVEADKAGLTAGLRSLLDLDFDAVLFAHGDPIASGGKAALRAFVDAQPS